VSANSAERVEVGFIGSLIELLVLFIEHELRGSELDSECRFDAVVSATNRHFAIYPTGNGYSGAR
jgi:hypothetical protein